MLTHGHIGVFHGVLELSQIKMGDQHDNAHIFIGDLQLFSVATTEFNLGPRNIYFLVCYT